MDIGRNEILIKLSSFEPLKLGLNPTPIHRLNKFEEAYHFDPLFIKRDDLNGIGPGGNKIRNLEFLLSDALRNNCNHVIASGKAQSNMCTLTAAACNKIGMKSTLVHNDVEPLTAVGNHLLNRILGVDEFFIGDVPVEERNRYVAALSAELATKGERPYIIFNGGTSPVGALGYVSGILEIAGQIERGRLPISDVFVSGGNGGLATGVVFGAACMDNPLKIHVISVENSKEELTEIMEQLFAEVTDRVGHRPQHTLSQVCEIYDEYRGEGWGIPLEEADQMIKTLASLEGIFLEKVYTAKAFNGMVQLLKKKQISVAKGSCFLHSGGFSSLFSQYSP